ncbi:MAG: DUF4430 domain-containing protein [Firmicutes bacterium]|nr:DUF4430 domain-containing protein [Bacillota bacterium]
MMRQGFLRYRKACGLVMIVVLLLAVTAGCGSAKDEGAGANPASETKADAGIFAWAEEAVATAQLPSAESSKEADGKTEKAGTDAAKTASASSSSASTGKTTASAGSSAKTAAASSESSSSAGSSEGESYGQGTPTPQSSSSGGKQAQPAAQTCTLSVECGSILNHLDDLTAGKESLVPADGVILPATSVSFSDGDTVFDVLKKTMREEGILFEFETTPLYSGVYIEGIANLYEFDCGPLSGWMYAVNGVFPNYGCGSCKVKDGDKIRWIYTCDLGRDIGGGDSAGQMGR